MTTLRQQPTSSRGKPDDGYVRCTNCGDITSDPRGVVGAIWCSACRSVDARIERLRESGVGFSDCDLTIIRAGITGKLDYEERRHAAHWPEPATADEMEQYGL